MPPSYMLALVLAMSVFTGMVVYSAMNGPRGWDQFWYIADVESLVEGRGIVTNNIFPAAVYKGPYTLEPPFVHNILNVYMAAPAAVFLGGYWGWIATNLLSTLLSTLLIYHLVSRLAHPLAALFSALLFLHLPLTFWLTSQPLSEATMFILSASFLAVFAFCKDSFRNYVYALGLAGLLLFCRKSFIPLLFLVPVIYLMKSRSRNAGTYIRVLMLLAMSASIILMADVLFPSGISWKLTDILMTAIPGENATLKFMFSLEPVDFSLSTWLTKAFYMLKVQFLPITFSLSRMEGLTYILLFLPFDLLAIIMTAYVWPRLWRENWALGGMIFVLLHLLTIAVFNNQARYMGPVMPVLVTAASAAFFRKARSSDGFRRATIALMVTIALTGIYVNSGIAGYNRTQGALTSAMSERLVRDFSAIIPVNDNVMVGHRTIIFLGYLLRPRRVLFVNDYPYGTYTTQQYLSLARKAETKWLVCHSDSRIPGLLDGYLAKVADISDNFMVYRFIHAP